MSQSPSEPSADQSLHPHPQGYSPPYGWYPPYPAEEEINLLDYFRVLKKHLGKIILLTFICTGLGAGTALTIKKKYKAEATITPLSQSGGGGGALAALAAQAASIPLVGGQLGLGSQKSGQIIGILKSRTLIENIVRDFNLMPYFFEKRWDDKEKKWLPDMSFLGSKENDPAKIEREILEDSVRAIQKKVLSVEEDKKTNLIKIQVELKNPELAATITNRFLVYLQDFINNNQLTVAKRNRIFIEDQLQKNKMDLLEAGKQLNQFYSSNQISSTLPQIDVHVGKLEEAPPTFEELRSATQQVQQQSESLKSKISEAKKEGVVHAVPSQVYLQYLTLQRELLGKVNGLLTQQYQMAKIEEAKEDLSFQIIDSAIPPAHPSKPQVLLIVAVSFVGGLFMSIFFAFFLEYVRKMREKEPKPAS